MEGYKYQIPENAKIRQFDGGKQIAVPVAVKAKNLAVRLYGQSASQRDIDYVAYTIYAIDQSPQNSAGAFTDLMAERVLNGRDEMEYYWPNGLPRFDATSQNGDPSENTPLELPETSQS